jgi:hypothetical protein
MKRIYVWVVLSCVVTSLFAAENKPLVLTPTKDSFVRSNEQIRNSGKSEALYIAHRSNIRALIAFDLSGITNEITRATLRFHPHESRDEKISMVIAPMVNTKNNVDWGEGRGNLGYRGQFALDGESCFLFSKRGDKDVQWESKTGRALKSAMESGLWMTPISRLNGLKWDQGSWVSVSILNLAVLEDIRTSDLRQITFGLWGVGGNGLYLISSKESRWSPELILELKEK